MRLNGDFCSVVDNGCICVFIMGYVQVCIDRVALINRYIQNAR